MARILPLLCIALSSFPIHNCDNLLNTIVEDGYFIVETIERNVNEFTSVPEIVDTLINDLFTDYGLTLSNDESDFALHNELVKFLLSTVDEQNEVLTGFPSEYRAIPRLLRELKVFEKREMAKLNEDDKEVMKAADMFTNYILRIKPMAKLIRQNMASYTHRDLSKEEIRQEIAKKRDRLLRLWGSDLLGTFYDPSPNLNNVEDDYDSFFFSDNFEHFNMDDL